MPRPDRLAWIKFSVKDWLNDRKLQRSSLAAQGLWINMICLMADKDFNSADYGRLAETGHDDASRPMTTDELAGWVFSTKEEVEPLLKELEDRHIYSVDADGYIFSRRLLRDRDVFLKASAAGAKGGYRAHKGVGSKKPPVYPESEEEVESEKNQKKMMPAENRTSLKDTAFDRLAKVARIDLTKLRRNSAWVTFPSVYDGWLSAGCDPEKDIWPTVEKMILSFQASTPGKSLPNTPAYLNQTVLMARDNRLKAEANGTAKPSRFGPGKFGDVRVTMLSGNQVVLSDSLIEIMRGSWVPGRQGSWSSDFGRSPVDPKCELPPEFIKELLAVRDEPLDEWRWREGRRPEGWV